MAAQVWLAVSGGCVLLQEQKSLFYLFAFLEPEIRAALCHMQAPVGEDAESLKCFRFLFQI